jgi:phage shock protein C
MYCTNCGVPLDDTCKFCSQCGAAVAPLTTPPGPAPAAPARKLTRIHADRKSAGVCAGFARYLNLDVTLFRMIFVASTLVTGVAPGVLTYLFAWIIMPLEIAPAPPATNVGEAGSIMPTRA